MRKLSSSLTTPRNHKIVKYALPSGYLLICLALNLCLSNSVFALSLATARIHSTLGSPLSISIDINNLGSLSAQQLRVSLAPDAVSASMKVESADNLHKLKFKIEQNAEDTAVIRISTKRNFNEPYANFVIHLRWPKGEIFKEVTLLVSPPMMKATEH